MEEQALEAKVVPCGARELLGLREPGELLARAGLPWSKLAQKPQHSPERLPPHDHAGEHCPGSPHHEYPSKATAGEAVVTLWLWHTQAGQNCSNPPQNRGKPVSRSPLPNSAPHPANLTSPALLSPGPPFKAPEPHDLSWPHIPGDSVHLCSPHQRHPSSAA